MPVDTSKNVKSSAQKSKWFSSMGEPLWLSGKAVKRENK
jgi:hypothetical protein